MKILEDSKLFIVRHGQCSSGDDLCEAGIQHVNNIADTIIEQVGRINTRSIILSSTAKRAVDSARIISEKTNIPIKSLNLFQFGMFVPENFDEACNLLRIYFHVYDVVILVSHLEYLEGFPRYFVRRFFDEEIEAKYTDENNVWLIDFSSGLRVTELCPV